MRKDNVMGADAIGGGGGGGGGGIEARNLLMVIT